MVVFGFLELVPSFGNYTFLRSFRVLRPLRAITKVAGLKVCSGGGAYLPATAYVRSSRVA